MNICPQCGHDCGRFTDSLIGSADNMAVPMQWNYWQNVAAAQQPSVVILHFTGAADRALATPLFCMRNI